MKANISVIKKINKVYLKSLITYNNLEKKKVFTKLALNSNRFI